MCVFPTAATYLNCLLNSKAPFMYPPKLSSMNGSPSTTCVPAQTSKHGMVWANPNVIHIRIPSLLLIATTSSMYRVCQHRCQKNENGVSPPPSPLPLPSLTNKRVCWIIHECSDAMHDGVVVSTCPGANNSTFILIETPSVKRNEPVNHLCERKKCAAAYL